MRQLFVKEKTDDPNCIHKANGMFEVPDASKQKKSTFVMSFLNKSNDRKTENNS